MTLLVILLGIAFVAFATFVFDIVAWLLDGNEPRVLLLVVMWLALVAMIVFAVVMDTLS